MKSTPNRWQEAMENLNLGGGGMTSFFFTEVVAVFPELVQLDPP